MTRRTSEHNFRQAISEILEQVYAIEYAMGLYYRKGGERDLARAQEDFETLRAAALEHTFRQAIPEILEQVYAIEYAMGLYYRKGGERDLARAQEDFETLRAA